MTSRQPPFGALLALALATGGFAGCPVSTGPVDGGPPPVHALDGVLRLHHIQVKGTHNSYHLRPDDIAADPWDYDQPPIEEQLDAHGVRQLELDVYFDPDTGGLDVFHIGILDPNSNCPTLDDCLRRVASFSEAHPAHVPVFVLVEPKNAEATDVRDDLGAFVAALEGTVEDTLGRERLLTPADVQGDAASLQEKVALDGWPLLGDVRGKVMVVLFDEGPLTTFYSHDDTHLDDRLLFVRGRTDRPFGVFVKHDDPQEAGADAAILADVERGFLVRTRADTDGNEARAGDTSRLEAALASGSHMISTDFPGPNEHDYEVAIPGGSPAGCNPMTAPHECHPLAVEHPAIVQEGQ